MSLRRPDLLACFGVGVTWSERCNGAWTMSLRRLVTGLLRCKGAVASFSALTFLCDGPVVVDGCKFRSCGLHFGLQMSHVTLFVLKPVGYKQDLGPQVWGAGTRTMSLRRPVKGL